MSRTCGIGFFALISFNNSSVRTGARSAGLLSLFTSIIMQQFLVASSHRWEQDCAFLRLCPVVNTFAHVVSGSCLRSAFFALISFVRVSSSAGCSIALICFSNFDHGTKAAQRHNPAPN